jgi:membrane protein implicated in regulation of membrane protease activity
MQMTPMYWLIFGIILIFVELATPGFIAMFFGMAALTVALITWLIPLGQMVPWLLFAVLSVVYILLLRKLLKKVFLGDKDAPDRLEDTFVGKYAEVVEPVAPGKPGRVEFNGCLWDTTADEEIEVGERVKIIAKNSLTLCVSKD